MKTRDDIHEGSGERIARIACEALSSHSCGKGIDKDLVRFRSVLSGRHSIGEPETGARISRKKHIGEQRTVRWDGPFCRRQDLFDRPDPWFTIERQFNRHQTGVEPAVDLTSKGEDTAGEADENEDRACEKANIEMDF